MLRVSISKDQLAVSFPPPSSPLSPAFHPPLLNFPNLKSISVRGVGINNRLRNTEGKTKLKFYVTPDTNFNLAEPFVYDLLLLFGIGEKWVNFDCVKTNNFCFCFSYLDKKPILDIKKDIQKNPQQIFV